MHGTETRRQRASPHSTRQSHGTAAVQESCAGSRPRLPAELWGAIARATLRAEGDDVRAWERLCRVSWSWRAGLQGDLGSIVADPNRCSQDGQLQGAWHFPMQMLCHAAFSRCSKHVTVAMLMHGHRCCRAQERRWWWISPPQRALTREMG